MASEFDEKLEISDNNLIEFDLFTVKNEDVVNIVRPLRELEASEDIINVAIRTIEWKGYTYTNREGTYIGYGSKNNLDSIGQTEEESYADFIARWKETERKLDRLISVKSLTQGQYDALVALLFFTGDFKKIGEDSYSISIAQYIIDGKWDYIATALVRATGNRELQRRLASVIMLGDYGSPKDRSVIKAQGLKDIRRLYPTLLTAQQQRQVEYVYYAETNRFLPNMTQSRMRQVVKLVESKI